MFTVWAWPALAAFPVRRQMLWRIDPILPNLEGMFCRVLIRSSCVPTVREAAGVIHSSAGSQSVCLPKASARKNPLPDVQSGLQLCSVTLMYEIALRSDLPATSPEAKPDRDQPAATAGL